MTARRALLLAAAVWMADQLTKAWVVTALPLGYSSGAVAGVFRLVHVRNRGIAFSLLHDGGPLVHIALQLVVAGVVVVLLVHLCRGTHDRWVGSGLALVLGGAVGNLTDRLLRGEVVDFLYFFVTTASGELSWPAFNVADSAITTGAGLIILGELRRSRRTTRASAAH